MPLDVAGFPIPSLMDTLKVIRITPISRAVLDQHKKSEVKKHPGHWLAPFINFHESALPTIATVALMTLFATVVIFIYDLCTQSLLLGIIPGFAFLLAAALLRGVFALDQYKITVMDKARWVESAPNLDSHHIPREIAALGKAIAYQRPGVSFILGTLIQNHITLDPYLIAKDGDEEAVLGIWDDDHIIMIAERPNSDFISEK